METVILDIDVNSLTIERKPVPERFQRLGGRAFTSTLVAEQVPPLCHPLGAENALVIAPGLLAGTPLSSANRLSAGAKSPLTGGIKECNSGGVLAYKLARLGIRGIRIRGTRPAQDPPHGIRVDGRGAHFESLADLKGSLIYPAVTTLRARYGERAGYLLIGPAGEMRLPTACLSVTDPEGEACRNLARGGLGAVLGAKGIKAVIADDSQVPRAGGTSIEVKELVRKFAGELRAHPVTGEKFPKYGTSMTLLNVNGLGGLPTRNFRAGRFELAERIGAEALFDAISRRGGQTTHACMPGCVIRCSNKYVDPQGSPVVGSLDYETLCLLGSNIGIGDLDQIAELNRLCNDIGIDTMETGGHRWAG